VTAFHPDYKMRDRGRTPVDTLLRASQHGKKAGLQFVYAGNLPGQVENTENTYCPRCQQLLVERRGFQVLSIQLKGDLCPSCNISVPGRWINSF